MSLTAAQSRVFSAMVEIEQRDGEPATIQAVCDALGIASKSTVQTHLQAMVRKGVVRRTARGFYTALRVVSPPAELPCPECGALCELVPLKTLDAAEENERVAEIRCANRHVVLGFVKPSAAVIERGRQLARERGW